jgi:alpha-beta hydrolase superfamily lysophospholipase
MTDGIHHQVVMIGARKSMIGMVTQPVEYEPADRPVFVILNSGIIHRVGHHRMYVRLARMLAGAGYQVLRFDLSGIGDSESRVDGLSPFEGVLADVREAVDWLVTARRARRIILVGLCSGADHSLACGVSDPRVCGLVLLDPSIPPTRGYYLRDFLRHLTRPQSWINLALGRGRRWRKVRKLLGLASDDAWENRWADLSDPEIRTFLHNAYQRAMDLRMQCLMVFTSGLSHQHNYRRQILDAFPTVSFAGKLQLEYFAGCDHLFTSEADRNRLFDIVKAWAQQTSFGGPAKTDSNPDQAVGPSSRDLVSYEI